jgi:hypothetical protein|tara:strand:- start:727 stop:1119 length:393 start_codon:yes stop_codon:yes gene_type:complete
MASDKRTYPNNYFAWYNDDDRVAIVCEDVSSSEGTKEKYDTYQGSSVTNGLRITYHSKYETVTDIDEDLKSDIGLDSGLHKSILCYVKYRLFEDAGDIQRAQYYYQMFEKDIKEWPHRRSSIRVLSVPKI